MEIMDKGQMAPNAGYSFRQRLMERITALRAERSTWLAHWQEISDHIFPRRFRYLTTDRNKGTKRNDKIINNKPVISMRVLAAGKMAGLTSPARPWLRLTVADTFLSDDDEVKGWLAIVEKALYETLAKSNIYNALHEVYGVQGAFATAAMYVEEDDEDDARAYVFPVGQFCIAASARQRVDTITREFSMTVAQLIQAFGEENCSPAVCQMYRDRKLDQWREVAHVIEPNTDRDPKFADAKNMPFRSVWFEKECDPTYSKMLRVSGYEEFPVMVARWYVTGEDVYGSGCPGMDMLGDCKALQIYERRKSQVVDKIVNPPMTAPASMKAQRLSLLPGDTNFVPDGQQGQFKPAIEVRPEAVTVVKDAIKEHENRIARTCYTDLFMMMLEDDRVQPSTAREINERHEEKMLQLGPVVERDEDELLDPLVNRLVGILARKGKIPPPPPQLGGQRVKIEYISVMAQAQKLLGTAATERLSSFVGSVSAVKPEVLDIVNFDKLVIEYAKMLGVPPDMINPESVVAQVRQARAQQQQAQAQGQAMLSAAEGAKVASQADLSGDSVLSRLLNTQGGGGGPIGRA